MAIFVRFFLDAVICKARVHHDRAQSREIELPFAAPRNESGRIPSRSLNVVVIRSQSAHPPHNQDGTKAGLPPKIQHCCASRLPKNGSAIFFVFFVFFPPGQPHSKNHAEGPNPQNN